MGGRKSRHDLDTASLLLMRNAVSCGDLEAAAQLEEVHPGIVRHITGYKRNWMHVAAAHGQADMVYWLARQDVNPNAVDNGGFFPLYLALARGISYGAVKALLDCGADVRARYLGVNIISSVTIPPSEKASAAVTFALAKLLVESGCDVDSVDAVSTPLKYAVLTQRRDVAFMLVEHGADPFSEFNHRALEGAAEIGANELVDEVRSFARAHQAMLMIEAPFEAAGLPPSP